MSKIGKITVNSMPATGSGMARRSGFKSEIDPLMSIDDVCHYLDIDRSTLDRWVKEGKILAPILMGGGSGIRKVKRWRRSELDAALDATRLKRASNVPPTPA